jgi:glycosyltransferase involved in cell wall biosynthesis
MENGNIPLVSIIITTRNEESVIGKLLKSIQTQTYPDIEIILVDNHSTDRTCEIARTYVDKLLIQGPDCDHLAGAYTDYQRSLQTTSASLGAISARDD